MAPCNFMFSVLSLAMHAGYISLGIAASEASTAEGAAGSPRMRGASHPILSDSMSRAATDVGVTLSDALDPIDELERGELEKGSLDSFQSSDLVDSPFDPALPYSVMESDFVDSTVESEQPYSGEDAEFSGSPFESELTPYASEESQLEHSPIDYEQPDLIEESDLLSSTAELEQEAEDDLEISEDEMQARYAEMLQKHEEDAIRTNMENWPSESEQPHAVEDLDWKNRPFEDEHGVSVFTLPLDKQYVPVIKNNITVTHKTAFFGTIYVGLPEPQAFSVLFDTGSGHFFIPSEKCDLPPCLKRRRYQRDLSFSALDIDHDGRGVSPETEVSERDKVAIEYGTGEVEGDFVSEAVCLTNHSGEYLYWADNAPDCTKVRVITTTEMSTQPFDEFAFDGVMGLGLASLAVHPEFSFFEQMTNDGRLHRMQFGVFLSNDDAVASEISFGGHDPRRVASDLSWVPVFEPERGYWQVQVRRVTVGGEPFQACEQGDCLAVVDTGTGLMGVPKQELSNFHWLLARRVLDKPEDIDCREFPGPEVVFHLDGVNITIGPQDYSRPSALRVQNSKSNTTDVICRSSLLPVEMPEEMSANTWIIGEPALRKYYTTYDWKLEQVGFALAKPPLAEAEKRHTVHGQPLATEVRAASVVTV